MLQKTKVRAVIGCSRALKTIHNTPDSPSPGGALTGRCRLMQNVSPLIQRSVRSGHDIMINSCQRNGLRNRHFACMHFYLIFLPANWQGSQTREGIISSSSSWGSAHSGCAVSWEKSLCSFRTSKPTRRHEDVVSVRMFPVSRTTCTGQSTVCLIPCQNTRKLRLPSV